MNLASYLPSFVDLMLKSTVVLALALLAARMWRRASAANRHMIWLAAFGALLVLPLTVTLLPSGDGRAVDSGAMLVLKVPVGPAVTGTLGQTSVASQASQPVAKRVWSLPAWRDGLVLIWLGGVAALPGWRMVGAVRLRLLRRRGGLVRDARVAGWCGRIAADHGITRAVELRASNECSVAMTWGTLRPVVMLPAEAIAWPDERLALVLRHELAHVRRGDCLARFFSQVACAFYWPNPMVWVAARRARLAQEQACDDRVLASGVAAETYAMELVAAVRDLNGRRWLGGAVAMAEPSTLESRIVGIIGEGRDRCALRGSTVALAVVVAALALAGCSAVQVRDARKTPLVSGQSSPTAAAAKLPQVMVVARFIEIKNTAPGAKAALAALEASAGRGAKAATIMGFLTEEQGQASLFKLSRLEGADVVSSPTVTVLAGNPAVIMIGQEMRYPTHWKKGLATAEWLPTEFETRNVGVELAVTPQMNADGTIELDVMPTLTEFEGFIEMEGKTASVSKNNEGPLLAGTSTDLKPPYKPIFTVRSVQALIPRLLSGQTVVLRLKEVPPEIRKITDTAIDGRELESAIDSMPVTMLVFVTAKIVPVKGAASADGTTAAR